MTTTITRSASADEQGYLSAKKAMVSEVALRLKKQGFQENGEVPAGFRQLFGKHLQDILMEVYFWQSRTGWEWESTLDVVDLLLQTLTPPSNEGERQKIIAAIPRLVRSIKKLRAYFLIDAAKIDALLLDLEHHHRLVLQAAAAPGAEKAPPAGAVKCQDEKLARAILEMRSKLPDIADVSVEEVAAAAGGLPRLDPGLAGMVFWWLARARAGQGADAPAWA